MSIAETFLTRARNHPSWDAHVQKYGDPSAFIDQFQRRWPQLLERECAAALEHPTLWLPEGRPLGWLWSRWAAHDGPALGAQGSSEPWRAEEAPEKQRDHILRARTMASVEWRNLSFSAKALVACLQGAIAPGRAAMIGRGVLDRDFGLPQSTATYTKARREVLEARFFDLDHRGWWVRPSTEELLRRLTFINRGDPFTASWTEFRTPRPTDSGETLPIQNMKPPLQNLNTPPLDSKQPPLQFLNHYSEISDHPKTDNGVFDAVGFFRPSEESEETGELPPVDPAEDLDQRLDVISLQPDHVVESMPPAPTAPVEEQEPEPLQLRFVRLQALIVEGLVFKDPCWQLAELLQSALELGGTFDEARIRQVVAATQAHPVEVTKIVQGLLKGPRIADPWTPILGPASAPVIGYDAEHDGP